MCCPIESYFFVFLELSLHGWNFFLQEEYKDKPEETQNAKLEPSQNNNEQTPPSKDSTNKQEAAVNLIDTSCFETEAREGSSVISDLAGLRLDCGDMPATFGSFLPSKLLQVFILFSYLEFSTSCKWICFCRR